MTPPKQNHHHSFAVATSTVNNNTTTTTTSTSTALNSGNMNTSPSSVEMVKDNSSSAHIHIDFNQNAMSPLAVSSMKQANVFKNRSSLRLKTISALVVMFVLLVCFCLAILLTSFFLIFQHVEYVESKASSRRVSRALYDDLKLLSDRTFEYGSFDETVELVVSFIFYTQR